ncbi:DUF3775 domain-containing protein [Bradyrhizobium sp. LHD-71]|uniref:DUF3775 domain-containing protein n=1 Tax=Bradyrhizobium sp. LHD-71 TaxID=3072141 RepID=UPI00280C7396|nr:DUF3775 domain-containing protein [Bradyrhizobium sp. LHD-71]MDQ8729360.1 DUF3775 domain-containing protein [Bradyrhizobium sp. LHD-71]
MPELSISKDKIDFLVTKAREFAGKDIAVDPDDASNPTDDRVVDVLEDRGSHDAVVREFVGLVNALSTDEQVDLVALMRLGRGDGGVEQWQELRREAARGHNAHTARYLLGEPLCGDLIEEGLNQLEAA